MKSERPQWNNTYCWRSERQLVETSYISLFRLHGRMLFGVNKRFERRDQLEIGRRRDVGMTAENKQESAQISYDQLVKTRPIKHM